MFKKLIKSLYAVPALMVATTLAFGAVPVSTTTTIAPTGTVTVLNTGLLGLVTFLYNSTFWIGGVMIFLSVIIGLALLAWQSFSDDEDAAKIAQKWFPKIVLAGLAGLLLATAPAIFTFVQQTLGGSQAVTFDPNAEQFRQQ
jgi:hypothetical protein